MFRLNNIKQNILIVVIATLFTGCGGGGGSSTSTESTTATSNIVTEPIVTEPDTDTGLVEAKSYVGLVGVRPVTSTAVEKGTIFASPTGTGGGLSASDPASLSDARDLLQDGSNGNVLFLRGGTYSLTEADFSTFKITRDATAGNEIIIESYPGEWAIIEGSDMPPESTDGTNYEDLGSLRLNGDYIHVRKLEVKNMPTQGVIARGSNFIAEGIETHHNGMSGLSMYDGTGMIARDVYSHHNSDVGYTNYPHDNGNNADGIGITVAPGALVEHCETSWNSDDGIDPYGTDNTIIRYNVSHNHGKQGGIGNGKGIKMGGPNDTGNQAYRNIAYSNASTGFDISESNNYNVEYANNTAWDNGDGNWEYGFSMGDDTLTVNNISSNNSNPENNTGIQLDNSWQREDTCTFISTDPASEDFLKPSVNGGCEDIGVYAE